MSKYSDKNSIKELKQAATNAKLAGRSKLTTKDDLVNALNRLVVTKKSSSKKSTSSEKSSSGEKLVFKFTPVLRSRSSVPDTLSHMVQLVTWYRGFAREQSEAEDARLVSITHDNREIIVTLKLNEPMSDSNKVLLMRAIADPDEDGNYPITVNNRDYLVIGEDIKQKINNVFVPIDNE